ncbi:OmpA-OmpF porin, OOP family [Ferrimonas sediminum]|uniref:OmpA-OmpF porin, OOP family n=1 Tax=Ferrimonas sediminum TaxID=718193 RepID=A0A1G8Q1D6_9GAMM|nr:OmpA family protein [Ferrimonas sediminum]SDI98275.1 OmpA-OmpF porin, OOP family [Ferrimonas sediminum]
MTINFKYLCFGLVLSAGAWAADRDDDGIPDGKDACPRQPATLGSGNGCPSDAVSADRILVLLFDSQSSRLSDAQLQKLEPWLAKWQGHELLIKGHADERGSGDINQALSLARANEVANVLALRYSISRRRLTLHALGETDPASQLETESGLAENRRVEVVARPIRLQLVKGE